MGASESGAVPRRIQENIKLIVWVLLSFLFATVHCWPTGLARVGSLYHDYGFGFPLNAGRCGCWKFFWICGYVRIPELLFNILFGFVAVASATEIFAGIISGRLNRLSIRQAVQAVMAFCLTVSLFARFQFDGIAFTFTDKEYLDAFAHSRLPVGLCYAAAAFVFFAAYFIVEKACVVNARLLRKQKSLDNTD